MKPVLVKIVPNIEKNGKLGFAQIFESEEQAEIVLEQWYNNKGIIICCDGYFNAVWLEY